MEDDRNYELPNGKGRELKERPEPGLPAEPQPISYTSARPDDEMGMHEYLGVILRRKWLVLSAVVVTVVTVLVASLIMTPMYRADITLEIAPDNPRITTFEEVVELDAPQAEFYETQYKLIKSKSLAEDVIKKLSLSENPEFSQEKSEKKSLLSRAFSGMFEKPGKKSPARAAAEKKKEHQKLVDEFLSRVNINPDRKSRLVKVSFTSRDSEFAATAANALGDQYIEWLLDRRLDATKSARKFLEKQLSQVKARLEKAEEDLNEFAKKEDIISLDANMNLTYKQLSELNGALTAAENERLAKQAFYEDVMEGKYEYLPQVLNDPSIQELGEEYTKVKAEYDNMSVVYGPNYPDLKQLGAQVASMKKEMDKRITGIAESIKKDYLAAVRKENIMKERTTEQNARASALNEKAIQYKILDREVETNKTIYQNLLQRVKETEVTSGIKATNIQIVDYAAAPLLPYSPNIPLNLVLALVAGLLGGVFLAFVTDHFDRTIKDEEELKQRFPIPFLGGIPVVSGSEALGLEKVVHTNPLSIVSEAFRVIRTSVLFSSPDSQPRSLLLTSSQPLEGKTTCSSNLAIAFTQSGYKVVLVDADMRRPRLTRVWRTAASNGAGLSTYLIGKYSLDDSIMPTEVDGLNIIYSGPIPPNPSELLGSNKMRELVDTLMERYDIVLVDGPPVLGFADSLLAARAVDGVLVVAGMGITQRKTLQMTLEELGKVHGKITGAIVNRLETASSRYRYNYQYHAEKNAKTLKISRPDNGALGA